MMGGLGGVALGPRTEGAGTAGETPTRETGCTCRLRKVAATGGHVIRPAFGHGPTGQVVMQARLSQLSQGEARKRRRRGGKVIFKF